MEREKEGKTQRWLVPSRGAVFAGALYIPGSNREEQNTCCSLPDIHDTAEEQTLQSSDRHKHVPHNHTAHCVHAHVQTETGTHCDFHHRGPDGLRQWQTCSVKIQQTKPWRFLRFVLYVKWYLFFSFPNFSARPVSWLLFFSLLCFLSASFFLCASLFFLSRPTSGHRLVCQVCNRAAIVSESVATGASNLLNKPWNVFAHISFSKVNMVVLFFIQQNWFLWKS